MSIDINVVADRVAEHFGVDPESVPTSGTKYILLTPEQVASLLDDNEHLQHELDYLRTGEES